MECTVDYKLEKKSMFLNPSKTNFQIALESIKKMLHTKFKQVFLLAYTPHSSYCFI